MAIPPYKNPLPGIQLDKIQSSLRTTNPSLAALLDRSGILNTPASPNIPVMIIPNRPLIDPQAAAPANIDISSGDVTSLIERFDSENQIVSAFGIPPESLPGQFAEFFRPLGTGSSPDAAIAQDAFINGELSLDEGNPQTEGSVHRSEINPTDQNDLFDFSASEIVSAFSNDSVDVVFNPQELKSLISSIIDEIGSLDVKSEINFKDIINYIPRNIKLIISDNGRINLVLVNHQLTEEDLTAVDEDDEKFFKYLYQQNIKRDGHNWVDKRFLSYLTGIFLKKFVPNPNSVFSSEQIELAVLLDRLINFLTWPDSVPSSALSPYADRIDSRFAQFCNSDSPKLNLKAVNLFLETDPSTKIPVSRIEQAFKAFCKLIDSILNESTEPAAKKRKIKFYNIKLN